MVVYVYGASVNTAPQSSNPSLASVSFGASRRLSTVYRGQATYPETKTAFRASCNANKTPGPPLGHTADRQTNQSGHEAVAATFSKIRGNCWKPDPSMGGLSILRSAVLATVRSGASSSASVSSLSFSGARRSSSLALETRGTDGVTAVSSATSALTSFHVMLSTELSQAPPHNQAVCTADASN